MRITIDIDGAHAPQSETSPSSTSVPDHAGSAATGAAAVDEESAAEVARRTGATDAGPAPSGPGGGTVPSGTSAAPGAAQWTGGGESAGAAPSDSA